MRMHTTGTAEEWLAARPERDLPLRAVSALLFALGTAATILSGRSMAAMGGMRMAGGWTMAMTWMRMPGQTWLGAAASFLGMWSVMMVPMMLPSLVPALGRYRRAVGLADARLAGLTATVGAAYFSVWTAFGAVIFSAGVLLANVAMQHRLLSRSVPIAVGVVVVAAGALQLTRWKARRLACCRHAPAFGRFHPASFATAWRHGLRLGLDCCVCCAGPTAILLVLGAMDLRVMALVTAAISGERLARDGAQVAKATGAIAIAAGLVLIARALGA